ncbi:MAG TPA: TMEM175 family protein [Dehalococcoidia bacterium]|jgi:uncharacterized membrane protein
MEAFSDGVFAIAITLLVLDLAVPNLSNYAVLDGLVKQWPAYLAYVVSFAAIGGAWISHTTITEYLESANALLLRLNLLLLFFVSIMPFPTHMLITYGLSSNAERLAVTLYGLNLLAISAITILLWRYAVAEQFIKRDTPEDAVRGVTAKLQPSIAFYGATVVIGLLVPVVAVILYLTIGFFLLIPFRAVFHHVRRWSGSG